MTTERLHRITKQSANIRRSHTKKKQAAPTTNPNTLLIALLESWYEGDAEEQRQVFEIMEQHIWEARGGKPIE